MEHPKMTINEAIKEEARRPTPRRPHKPTTMTLGGSICRCQK